MCECVCVVVFFFFWKDPFFLLVVSFKQTPFSEDAVFSPFSAFGVLPHWESEKTPGRFRSTFPVRFAGGRQPLSLEGPGS